MHQGTTFKIYGKKNQTTKLTRRFFFFYMEFVPIDLENLNLSSEFVFSYFKQKKSESIRNG